MQMTKTTRMEGYAESGVPTAAADGAIVKVNYDTYGKQRLAGFDQPNNTIAVEEQSPAISQKMGPLTFTQLTAAGSTAVTNVSAYRSICYMVTVASINTSVTVRVEGSHDNTSWFNMDDGGCDTVYTANGTYQLSKSGISVKYVRFTFVSEVGGTAVTLDVQLIAGN